MLLAYLLLIKNEKKDLEYTNTLGLTIIKPMGSKKTVRILFSTFLFCMMNVQIVYAEEKGSAAKSLAQGYIGHPNEMWDSYPHSMEIPPCGPCGNCEACHYGHPYNHSIPSDNLHPSQQFSQPTSPNSSSQADESASNPSLSPLLQPLIPIYKKPNCGPKQEGYTVNFEDVSIIQLIQFISKISAVNYIFDSEDLINPQTGVAYKITLVSEDPTQVADLSAALLQVLNMYGLSVVEQGNNVLIYRNQNLSKVSTVITDDNIDESCENAVITRVFQLYNLDPQRIAGIVRTLASPSAVVDASVETRHLIVTDITANVNKIADLLSALDTPTMPIDVAEYQVRHADPITLAEYALEILHEVAGPTPLSITPEPASGKIFIVGTPVLINRALQVMASLDVPEIAALHPLPIAEDIANNEFYMYKLKYADGLEIAAALHDIGTNLQFTGVANIDFINAIYTAQWLEVNNSIVITGTPDAIEKIVALLDDLDQLPKQVYIEVLVLDTTLQNSLDFGVQWIALGEEQSKLAFATGLLGNGSNLQSAASTVAGGTNPATGSPPAIPSPTNLLPLPTPPSLGGFPGIANLTEAFSLGIIGNVLSHNGKSFLTLGALLSALDEQSDSKVVINPKIMVEDTQPANFFVGQNIPYQTTSTVIQQTGSVTQNIQYEDIGVQLQVTPTISPNNIVTLQINQTVADVVDQGANLTPTTNKQLVTTRVHVPDGAFLVMSGHTRDQCTYIRSGIPCLGTLPLIGPVFSRNIENRQKRNLIFFIRPKVVTNIEESIILTNEEGYEYNWNSNPCSLRECDCPNAPECETYPSPDWPPRYANFPCSEPISPPEPVKEPPSPPQPSSKIVPSNPPPPSTPTPPYEGFPEPLLSPHPDLDGDVSGEAAASVNPDMALPPDYLNYPYSEHQAENYPYTEYVRPLQPKEIKEIRPLPYKKELN